MADPVDTNVVIRYLVDDPASTAPGVRGVFPFFEKLERGEHVALLTPLVVFQSYFVLTSYYEVPAAEAATRLRDLLQFRGLRVPEKAILRRCLETLAERSLSTWWMRIWLRCAPAGSSTASIRLTRAWPAWASRSCV